MIRAFLMAAAGAVLDALGRRREAAALQARAEQAEQRCRELEHRCDVMEFACDGYEQELGHLRVAARQALTAFDGQDPGDVKASTLAAFLRVSAEHGGYKAHSRGQTILRLQNRLTRWQRRYRRAAVLLRATAEPTRGELINARARASAARVEAERAVEVAKGDVERELAIGRLKAARLAEERAKAAEAAAGDG